MQSIRSCPQHMNNTTGMVNCQIQNVCSRLPLCMDQVSALYGSDSRLTWIRLPLLRPSFWSLRFLGRYPKPKKAGALSLTCASKHFVIPAAAQMCLGTPHHSCCSPQDGHRLSMETALPVLSFVLYCLDMSAGIIVGVITQNLCRVNFGCIYSADQTVQLIPCDLSPIRQDQPFMYAAWQDIIGRYLQ